MTESPPGSDASRRVNKQSEVKVVKVKMGIVHEMSFRSAAMSNAEYGRSNHHAGRQQELPQWKSWVVFFFSRARASNDTDLESLANEIYVRTV